MIQNHQSGINSTPFKDSDIHAGPQATTFMSMVVSSTKFQTFHSVKSARSILKNSLLETITSFKKSSLQKKLGKMARKIKKKASKRILRTTTTWRDNSNFQTKLISLLLRSSLTK
jgi:ribosomal protein S20